MPCKIPALVAGKAPAAELCGALAAPAWKENALAHVEAAAALSPHRMDWLVPEEREYVAMLAYRAVNRVFEEDHRDEADSDLQLALGLAAEARRVEEWGYERWRNADWHRDAKSFSLALEHSSVLVRSLAALGVGLVHAHLLRVRRPVMSTMDLLQWTGEVSSVAGGLFSGAGWIGTWPLPEIENRFLRQWLLDVLARNPPSINIPRSTPLEFYAKEFFAFDLEAIEELYRIGRADVADEAMKEREFLLRDGGTEG